jgi:hypothetical protein
MTAEENERITNERDLNDPLLYAHQGLASAARSGSNDSTRITKTFDDHMKDLQAFKEEHGHCNVKTSKSDKNKKYKSLGNWCSNIRHSYKKIKQGGGKEHLIKYLMPISSALKGWDSSGDHENMKEIFLLTIA